MVTFVQSLLDECDDRRKNRRSLDEKYHFYFFFPPCTMSFCDDSRKNRLVEMSLKALINMNMQDNIKYIHLQIVNFHPRHA